MVSPFRILASVVLVFALALTGHQAAVARGAAPAMGEAVICIGQTVVTIQLDADGQPVETHHLCPDAALGLFVAEAGGFALTTPFKRTAILDWREAAQGGAESGPQRAQARGPPVFV